MDRHWRFPSYAWGTTGIFYRKSMLKDAGVNPEDIKTQEDFRKRARSLRMTVNMQWALYLEHMHSQSVSGTV